MINHIYAIFGIAVSRAAHIYQWCLVVEGSGSLLVCSLEPPDELQKLLMSVSELWIQQTDEFGNHWYREWFSINQASWSCLLGGVEPEELGPDGSAGFAWGTTFPMRERSGILYRDHMHRTVRLRSQHDKGSPRYIMQMLQFKVCAPLFWLGIANLLSNLRS